MFLRRLPASSSLSVAVASQAFTCCYEGRSLLDSTPMTCRRLFPFPTHCTPTNSLSSRCPFCCRFLLVRVWMTRRQRRNTYERECLHTNNNKKCGRHGMPPPASDDTGTSLGQDGSDGSRVPATLTFDLGGHGACGWCGSSSSIGTPSLKFVGLPFGRYGARYAWALMGLMTLTFDLLTLKLVCESHQR